MAIEERNRTLDFRPPPWPEDFPQRLERLKKLAGVSWKRMAERLGGDGPRRAQVAQDGKALGGQPPSDLGTGPRDSRRLRPDDERLST